MVGGALPWMQNLPSVFALDVKEPIGKKFILLGEVPHDIFVEIVGMKLTVLLVFLLIQIYTQEYHKGGWMESGKKSEKKERSNAKDTYCVTCGYKNCPRISSCDRAELEENSCLHSFLLKLFPRKILK
jgi:hypothetical protein